MGILGWDIKQRFLKDQKRITGVHVPLYAYEHHGLYSPSHQPVSHSSCSFPHSSTSSSLLGGGMHRHEQLTPGFRHTAPKSRAPCQKCGRFHSPHSLCYGPNYEQHPSRQMQQHSNTVVQHPQVHMTSSYNPEQFAPNADLHTTNLHWPPPMSMITVVNEPETLVSAAAPVPFSPSTNLESRRHARPAPQNDRPAPAAPILPASAHASAFVQIPLKALGEEKLLQLLRTQPESTVSFSMNAKTSVALLERTDILSGEAGSNSQGNAPVVALTSEPKSAGTVNTSDAQIQDYFRRPAGLYRLKEGLTLEHNGFALQHQRHADFHFPWQYWSCGRQD
ncbi:hypothetical protein DUNSADRAFT_11674 [Dunaliella salina]|uniref:Encoded protein n=1 Tax=Dunaliella salina TaxID=3046 RepID=A0ABZ3KTD0_DUNSA|nr:hypothetical protein DUNSADRAFT_11674 [Dunaliella salina]|eukprot:KAF5832428.1 hypothetical protein DUNSADRAFT_11674 [Dunaliella salina]